MDPSGSRLAVPSALTVRSEAEARNLASGDRFGATASSVWRAVWVAPLSSVTVRVIVLVPGVA